MAVSQYASSYITNLKKYTQYAVNKHFQIVPSSRPTLPTLQTPKKLIKLGIQHYYKKYINRYLSQQQKESANAKN